MNGWYSRLLALGLGIVTMLTVSSAQPPIVDVAPTAPATGTLEDQPEIVPLATAAPPALPPLKAVGSGCCLRPDLSCPGPAFCPCVPLVYFQTDPRDDDWTNPLYECAGGGCGTHWYEHALRMVVRKKNLAEWLAQ